MAVPFEVTVRPSRPAESWQLSELRIYNIISDPIPDELSYWDVRSLQELIDSGNKSLFLLASPDWRFSLASSSPDVLASTQF